MIVGTFIASLARKLWALPAVYRLSAVVVAVSATFIPFVIRLAKVARVTGPVPSWAIPSVAALTFALLLCGGLLPPTTLWRSERWRKTKDPELRRQRLDGAVASFRRGPALVVAAEGLLWAVYLIVVERALAPGMDGTWHFNAADLADLGARTMAAVALLPLVDWLLSPLAIELGNASRAEGRPAGQIGPSLTTLLLVYTTTMVLSPWLSLLQFHLRGALDWPHLSAYLPGFFMWLVLAVAGLSRFVASPLRASLRQVNSIIRADGTIGPQRLAPVPAAELDQWAAAVNLMLDRLAAGHRELQLRLAERDQLTLEAHRALHLRDEFIDIASHELRTPLTALMLQLGRLSQSPDGSVVSAVEGASRNARRLAALVNTLLDVSRIQAGGLEIIRKPTRLRAYLQDVLGSASGISWAPIQIEVSPDIEVELDPERMEQVLINLVGNARKYGPTNAAIVVRARMENGEVLISVVDQGPGVLEGDREAIFERFFRGEAATHSSQGGFGLGLYICKTIVERHGGRIWVAPGEAGKGSAFFIRLPDASAIADPVNFG